MDGGEARRAEVALEVHLDHGIPLVLGHVERHLVPQDAGVVHEHVEGPVGLDGLPDEGLGAFPAGDVVVVGDRRAARGDHLVDHLLGGTVVLACTGPVPAEVVDDNAGAFGAQQQRLGPSDSPTGSGDDRHFPVEQPHWSLLLPGRPPGPAVSMRRPPGPALSAVPDRRCCVRPRPRSSGSRGARSSRTAA